MKNFNKNKTICLFSNDVTLQKYIEQYMLNNKNYNRLCDFLRVAGNFKGKVLVDLYEYDEENKIIKVIMSDLDDNIFVVCLSSKNRNDLFIVNKISDSDDIKYDLSLIKKNDFSDDNLKICKTDKLFTHKFGRLITDEKSFLSIFLPDNICYHIELSDGDDIKGYDIVNIINQFNTIPSFKDFIDCFELLLSHKKQIISEITLYKNFVCFSKIDFNFMDTKRLKR